MTTCSICGGSWPHCLPHLRVRLTIDGEMASKANSRRIVTNRATGRPMSIKSAKARSWWDQATQQLLSAGLLRLYNVGMGEALPDGELTMWVHAYYATERPDLDESVLLDVLQTRWTGVGKSRRVAVWGVFANDRQVRERHVYHHIDAERPRVEVVLTLRGDSL